MAAATLKSIACWMEGQLEGASPCRALVQQVLTQLVQEASQMGSRCAGAQGPTIRENEAWDSMLPTQQSIGLSEVSGRWQHSPACFKVLVYITRRLHWRKLVLLPVLCNSGVTRKHIVGLKGALCHAGE